MGSVIRIVAATGSFRSTPGFLILSQEPISLPLTLWTLLILGNNPFQPSFGRQGKEFFAVLFGAVDVKHARKVSQRTLEKRLAPV